MHKKTPEQSFGKIKIIFVVYVAVLVFLLLIFLLYARKTLILYEASQPQYVMDRLITTPSFLSSMNTSGLLFNEFETKEDYEEQLAQFVSENPVEYHFLKESYTDGSLTYGIYAGKTPIGTAVLKPQNTVIRMIALPITDWTIAELNAYEAHGNYDVTVTVPDNYTVKINDVILSDTYITKETPYPELIYCQEYTEVPVQVTYQISDLKQPAQVAVLDADGQDISESGAMTEASESTSENRILSSLPAQTEMPQELQAYVLDAVITYSNFFSNDLPGGQTSIDPIRQLFPKDSPYLSLAEQYRQKDMRFFTSHSNTAYSGETITEYIPYNESCFSCRVSFEKSMTISGGREVIDTTDNVYYFVLLDGVWVIADIR